MAHTEPPRSSATRRGRPPKLAKLNSYAVNQPAWPRPSVFLGMERLGAGQRCIISIKDNDGQARGGGTTGPRLTVPPDAPVSRCSYAAPGLKWETHTLFMSAKSDRAGAHRHQRE